LTWQPAESEFYIHLDKRYQRADWGQRPLPAYLLAYARLDTHYLIELRHRLKAELEKEDRWLLAAEDFRRLCHINQRSFEPEIEPDFSLSGAKDLTAQQAVLLGCQVQNRIAVCRTAHYLKCFPQNAIAIAEACPANHEELANLPGMTPRQIQRYGKQLLTAVQRGLHASPVHPPRPHRADERTLARLDRLREWRKRTALALKVESDVVLPRDLMTGIAEKNPKCADDLAEILSEVPWRMRRFGQEIFSTLVNGKNKRA
jgi:ribonuclease D